jgi:hypothetical protein
MDLNTITPQALRRAADLKEQIDALQQQLNGLMGAEVSPTAPKAPTPPKHRRAGRKISPQAIARIRAGVAKQVGKKAMATKVQPAPKKRGTIGAAGRAKLSALAKARWSKAKAAGKSSL